MQDTQTGLERLRRHLVENGSKEVSSLRALVDRLDMCRQLEDAIVATKRVLDSEMACIEKIRESLGEETHKLAALAAVEHYKSARLARQGKIVEDGLGGEPLSHVFEAIECLESSHFEISEQSFKLTRQMVRDYLDGLLRLLETLEIDVDARAEAPREG